MNIVILKQAKKEIQKAPKDVIQDIFALFDELMNCKKLDMPISRPLPSIAKGLHELRLSGRSGEFRVFYLIRIQDAIYVIHAMQKKTQQIDARTVGTLKIRLRELGI